MNFVRHSSIGDVRDGSKVSFLVSCGHVRFIPESDQNCVAAMALGARSDIESCGHSFANALNAFMSTRPNKDG